MGRRAGLAAAVAAILAGVVAAACHDQATATPAPAAAEVACPPCVTDADCHGGVCAQLGADTACAPACPNGDECAADRACVSATSVTGAQISVCVPRADECGLSAVDTDAGPPPATCPGLVPPTQAAPCTSCTGKASCQTNGCYGGWWCNTATNRCQAPPTNCGATGGPFDGGAPVTGTVGPTGGTLNRLYFAVVGDTRPPSPDDTTGYPTAVIQKIFAGVQGLNPRPAFVVGTGDYMFASTSGSEGAAQLDLYLSARGQFTGPSFPTMGNHECTGATASNCGPGSADGVTNNYTAFLQKMLGPIGQAEPYYSIHVDAQDGSWTSKLVFVAGNAWSPAQAAWLDGELAKPTTYTFIVRHEPANASTAPGVDPSEQIMAKHPYTLALVGHTHTYQHYRSSREVIVGNGGAPLTGGKNYGFAVIQQRPDQSLQVDMLDYATLNADTAFRFAVKADGTAAP
jgi:hypothetical protein